LNINLKALCGLGLLGFGLCVGAAVDLPDMGSSAGAAISPQAESRIGRSFMRALRRAAYIIEDPELHLYIQSLGDRLVASADEAPYPFTFFIVDDHSINAFAAPGGYVGVNAGLILGAQSESELSSVLAHEVAHVTQRHMARGTEAAGRLGWPTIAALVAAALIGTQNATAGQAAAAGALASNIQYQINFTRANEIEADAIGIRTLARAGFDPTAMAGFFERLQKTSRYYDGQVPEILRTHPVTLNRIADAQARAQSLGQHGSMMKGGEDDGEAFALARARLEALTGKDVEAEVAKFSSLLESGRGGSATAARYGLVIALTRAGKYDQARKEVGRLIESEPEHAGFLLAAAQIDMAQRHFGQSIAWLDKAMRLHPTHYAVVVLGAEARMNAGRPEEARALLRRHAGDWQADPLYLALLSRAEGESGNVAEAYLAAAERYFVLGETGLAIEQLETAHRQHGTDYYVASRIDARLQAFKRERAAEDEGH